MPFQTRHTLLVFEPHTQVVLKIQASKSTLTLSRKGQNLPSFPKDIEEKEKSSSWVKHVVCDQSLHGWSHGNRLSPGLTSPGVELFIQKEVGFSPSFHVVLLKVQEANKTKLSLEGDLVLCTFNLCCTFVTSIQG